MAQADHSPRVETETVTVLCVAATPGKAEVTGICLQRVDDRITAQTAATVPAALDHLRNHDIDCVVSEYKLDRADGLVLLEAVRANRPDFPIILFAGRGSEAVASRAITAGVTDYVAQSSGPDQYDRLAGRITNAVRQRQHSTPASPTEKRVRTTLEQAPDPVFITFDGDCVYANESARSLLGGDPTDRSIASVLDLDSSTIDNLENGSDRLTSACLDAGSTPVRVTARRIDWDGDPGAVYVCPPTDDDSRELQTTESEDDLLDGVFRSAPDGVLVAGPDGSILTYNDRFPSLWGVDPAAIEDTDLALVGRLLSDSVEGSNFEAQFAELADCSEPQRSEITLTDGGLLEQYAAPLRTAEGERLGTALYYRNLSEGVHVGNASEPVFDRISDAVCALDNEWRFTYVNDHATELTDTSRDELLGTRLWDAFPGLVGTELEEQYREAIATGETFTTEVYHEPFEKHLEIRVYPSETGMTIYFRNISREKDIETELRRTVEELELLYEVAADQEQSFEAKRRQLLRIGSEYLDLPYGFITKIGEGEQLIVESIGNHELLQPGESCALEQSYCRKTVLSEEGFLAVQDAADSGWEDDLAYETFDLGTYIGAKLLVNGELYGTLCFASTTPRKREFSDSEQTIVEVMAKWLSYEYGQRAYRQQLEEQNERLERFASMVSHDFRNPLNVAMTRLELAREEYNSDHLDSVANAHDRMQSLIEDVLLLARQDGTTEDRTDLHLGAVARQSWESVETGEAVLSVEDDRTVSADKSRLIQLFENLFRNSVEHGAADGDEASGLTITVGTLGDGFYVEDDGVGIPPEDRDRIFEEGFSGSPGGTGLGLNIVSEIVDAHGWAITGTESDEGGARIEITGV